MLALGMLADLNYSDTSPPIIDTNPYFKKMWWFDNNPGDDLRRFDTQQRTGPSRAAGNIIDNPILSTNGLFILHTTKNEHKPFSISSIHDRGEYDHDKEGLHLITYDAIKRRNLLRKINYTSYWKIWIEASDFSDVPDADVVKIGSIEEAVFIVTQIYYAFLNDANDNSDDVRDVEIDEEDVEDEERLIVGNPPPPPPSLNEDIKHKLKAIIHPQSDKAHEIYKLSTVANDVVQKIRDTFSKEANAADALEERIKQIKQGQMVTRQTTQTVETMTQELSATDKELDERRHELTAAKEESAKLESELKELESVIIDNVTNFIRDLISQRDLDPGVKAAIKNIIMRNKLKNILKFGIFHKRLSLSQIILFFRSLGYDIINIVDPSCFVLKPPRSFQTDIDTPIIEHSQQGLSFEPKHHPLHWTEEIRKLESILPDAQSHPVVDLELQPSKRPAYDSGDFGGRRRGGTKRKKSYSRKRRTRRKRCITRRHRRMRK